MTEQSEPWRMQQPAPVVPIPGDAPFWVLFRVPTPTPDGQSARDLYEKRERGIGPAMQESAVGFGCTFHRAWHAADGSAFYALARWSSRAGAMAFFESWQIDDEPGEVAIRLEGDIGLVPLG
jgi:hypothetical protein